MTVNFWCLLIEQRQMKEVLPSVDSSMDSNNASCKGIVFLGLWHAVTLSQSKSSNYDTIGSKTFIINNKDADIKKEK